MIWRRSVALAVMSLAVVNIVVFVTSSWGTQEFVQHLMLGPAFLAYPAVALAILWRRSHPVAWILLILGVLVGPLQLVSTFLLERPAPISGTTGWRIATVASAIPFPLFATLLPALGLRFPTGRALSHRWRWLELAYAVGVVAVLMGMMLTPMIRGGPAGGPHWLLGNPLSESWTEAIRKDLELVAGATLFPAIVLSIASIVIRFRRSAGVERQQMRWMAYSLLGVLVTWPLAAGAAFLVFGEDGMQAVAGFWSILVLVVPAVGIGVAVTRHRLYDLDRIVSRTLSYTVLAALLAAAYAGSVVGLSAVVRSVSGGSSDLVVALSTLLVAALFQPVRGRVQAVVERRFNRRRYDAQRTLESFGRSLRDELDAGALVASLHEVAATSLQPSLVSVQLVRGVGP